jgi:hypothetical protein
VLIKERLMLMCVKDEILAMNAGSGGDGNQVIVTAPEIIERKARWIMMRFAILLLTRKEHRDTSTLDWNDFERVEEDLRSVMQVHLRDVELQYNIQEEARNDTRVNEPSEPM